MLDMDMAILMVILDTMDTTLARGRLMLSLRPRLTPHSCTLPMDMVILTLMDMPDTHMPGENKLMMS